MSLFTIKRKTRQYLDMEMCIHIQITLTSLSSIKQQVDYQFNHLPQQTLTSTVRLTELRVTGQLQTPRLEAFRGSFRCI